MTSPEETPLHAEIKSVERRQNLGEVFTPPEMVKEMHELITPEDWADLNMVYLEPSCGTGNFLVQAIVKKWQGKEMISAHQAYRTTYGLDIMQDNVQTARDRMFGILLSLYLMNEGPSFLRHPLTIRSMAEALFWLERNVRLVSDSLDYMKTPDCRAWLEEEDGVYGDWNFKTRHYLEASEFARLNRQFPTNGRIAWPQMRRESDART